MTAASQLIDIHIQLWQSRKNLKENSFHLLTWFLNSIFSLHGKSLNILPLKNDASDQKSILMAHNLQGEKSIY